VSRYSDSACIDLTVVIIHKHMFWQIHGTWALYGITVDVLK
jgi:hypothetical protein